MKSFLVFRGKRFSFIYEKKSTVILALTFIVSLLAIVLSLSVGQKFIGFHRVFSSIFNMGIGGDNLIINTIRLPRILVAFFVGASLGLSGAVLQGVVKKPPCRTKYNRYY